MIYLLRHGETAFNAAGRYQGQADSPLTERGEIQALSAGEVLAARLQGSKARVFCSPLGRARQTAELVAGRLSGGAEIISDPRLVEIGMGAWDGLTRPEIEALSPRHRKDIAPGDWYFRSPDGERFDTLAARLAAVMAEITEDPAREKIVVSHGVAGRVIRGLHAGLSRAEMVQLDAPQNAVFVLRPGGEVERLDYFDG